MQSTYVNPHQITERPLWYSAGQMDKFTETSTDMKEYKGHMRVNSSNLFQTRQELLNSNKDEV